MARPSNRHAGASGLRIGPIGIRTLLALSIGGLVLAAAATVLTIALFASARNTFELLGERTVLILDGIESEVRDKLQGAADVVAGVVRELETGQLRNASPQDIHDALSAIVATAPEVEVLLVWDGDLERRLAARDPDGAIVEAGPEPEDNPRIRQMLENTPVGARVWGEPVAEEGRAFINVAAQVDSAASGVRYVVAAVSLGQFSRFVDEIGRSYRATAFILYGEDHLLAHPSLVNDDTVAAGHAVVPIADVHDPVLLNLGKGEPVEVMDAARRKGAEVLRVDAGDTTYVAVYRRLGGYGPKPITVGAYFPRTEIADTLRRLSMSGIAGVLVTLIGVLAAILLGGLIARPVRRLASSASAVARLDLDAVEPPRRSSVAEIDEQVRAFNLMLDALKVFQTYVPRKLVERLVALDGGEGIHSETRELTVMFTDIVKFSEVAERMGAEETAAFLNRHFGLLADCIRAEHGTIDKYIGDAVMAFWGAPERLDDHAVRGVQAARRIAETITADNQRRARKGLRPVRVRIGLHSGPAVVGNIGAPDRVNYTIVGDTVNDAQRLESLGHKLDTGADVTILMSAHTAQLAGLTDEAEDVGAHPLAGGPHEVAVRRLNCRLPATVVVEVVEAVE